MSRPERWLVAVSAGRQQLIGIRAAKMAGLSVLAVDGHPAAPGFALADRSITIDIRDAEAVVEAVEASGIRPAGAVNIISDVAMRATTALRERFALPGIRERVGAALTNKAIQRETWEAKGVPVPRFRVVRSLAEGRAALEAVGVPAIVKPVDNAGSRGVSKVDHAKDLESAVNAALAASASRTILVEAFVRGAEYSVETFGVDGVIHVLAISRRTLAHHTTAVEIATEIVPDGRRRLIEDTVRAALMALDYSEGPGHTEVIVDDANRAVLVETAGRAGGFMVGDGLVPAVSDFDLPGAIVLQAVGLPTPPVSGAAVKVVRFARLRYLTGVAGRVASIRGFEQANEVPGVRAESLVAVGDAVWPVRADGDRLGYLLAVAETEDECRRRADLAEALISFEIA